MKATINNKFMVFVGHIDSMRVIDRDNYQDMLEDMKDTCSDLDLIGKFDLYVLDDISDTIEVCDKEYFGKNVFVEYTTKELFNKFGYLVNELKSIIKA